MKNTQLFFLFSFVIVFISCDKKNNDKDYIFPEFDSNQSNFSNTDLLNATYTDYKIPKNFYSEDLGDTNLYYVNTVSIDSNDNNRRIYLSSNSNSQAYNWTVRSTYENSVFADGIINEKYFEYTRIENPFDKSIIKFRTHRADYLTRDEYHVQLQPNKTGIYTKAGFSIEDAKELIDYLWFVDNYNNSSAKILSSYATESEEAINVVHYELITVYGDFNINDILSLYVCSYQIEKSTGVIILQKDLVKEIEGEEN